MVRRHRRNETDVQKKNRLERKAALEHDIDWKELHKPNTFLNGDPAAFLEDDPAAQTDAEFAIQEVMEILRKYKLNEDKKHMEDHL